MVVLELPEFAMNWTDDQRSTRVVSFIGAGIVKSVPMDLPGLLSEAKRYTLGIQERIGRLLALPTVLSIEVVGWPNSELTVEAAA